MSSVLILLFQNFIKCWFQLLRQLVNAYCDFPDEYYILEFRNQDFLDLKWAQGVFLKHIHTFSKKYTSGLDVSGRSIQLVPTYFAILDTLYKGFLCSLKKVLGIDSEFCNVEAIVTGLVDNYPQTLLKHRKLFTVGLCAFMFILGLPMCTNVSIELCTLCII